MRRLAAAGLVAVALLVGAACSSSGGSSSTSTVVPSAACVASMKAYHDGLVSTNSNLTDPQLTAFQNGTVTACTQAEWLTAVKPYTGNQITDIVIGKRKPTDVLEAYCKADSSAKACS